MSWRTRAEKIVVTLGRQAAWREQLKRIVAVQPGAYQGCACARVRCWKPHKDSEQRELDDSNTECAVHKPTADAGMLPAHNMVLRLLPDAEILSEVPAKSLGKQGRAILSGRFVRLDMKVDLLVKGPSGLYCAIEVDGREHKDEEGLLRDAKKQEYLQSMHVRLIRLELTHSRRVPVAKWLKTLSFQIQAGNLC